MKVLHKIIHCQRQKVSRKCVDISVKTNEVETGLFIFYDDMFTTSEVSVTKQGKQYTRL